MIAPGTVLVGEPATVTLALRIDCVPDPFPVHVVLAVDDTAAMATPGGRDVRRALRGWVVGLPTHPGVSTLRVGVVGWRATRMRVRCALRARLDLARRCIDRLASTGEGEMSDGIVAALDLLAAGRPAGGDRDAIREVIVVVSGDAGRGRDDGSACVHAAEAARKARGQSVLLVVSALGDGVEHSCLPDLATSPRYFFALPGRPPALARLARIVDAISSYDMDDLRPFRSVTIVETLPVSATFVAGAFDPMPGTLEDASAQWHMTFFPREGMSFTYQVRVAAPGTIELPAYSGVTVRDYRQRTTQFEPQLAHLRVISGPIDPSP